MNMCLETSTLFQLISTRSKHLQCNSLQVREKKLHDFVHHNHAVARLRLNLLLQFSLMWLVSPKCTNSISLTGVLDGSVACMHTTTNCTWDGKTKNFKCQILTQKVTRLVKVREIGSCGIDQHRVIDSS